MWKWLIGIVLAATVCGQTAGPAAGAGGHGSPAVLDPEDLAGFAGWPGARRELVATALAVARDSPWLPYTTAGSSPEDGGFDCSGAMYFVMRKAGLEPPRTSAAQREWVRKNSELHEVPSDAVGLDDSSLAALRPGDLLFWGHPDESPPRVSHVAMYLGTEKKDGRAVMINSTDGRSYRGVKANGYGVYDFRLPKAGSRSAFMGYGTPPGLLGEE